MHHLDREVFVEDIEMALRKAMELQPLNLKAHLLGQSNSGTSGIVGSSMSVALELNYTTIAKKRAFNTSRSDHKIENRKAKGGKKF